MEGRVCEQKHSPQWLGVPVGPGVVARTGVPLGVGVALRTGEAGAEDGG